MRRALLALAIVLAILGLAPAAASAHAVLERSEPARGADPATQPDRVTLFFNEPVESAFGSVRVFDSSGEEVQAGDVIRPSDDGSVLATALEPGLPDGTYTVTYRVVSADSHPVSGGFVFSIGEPDSGGASVAELLEGQEGTGGTSTPAFVADRWIAYVATALLVGGLAFLLGAAVPAGAGRRAMTARLRRVMVAAAGAGLLASLLALPLQIAAAAGVSFADAFSADLLREVLSTRFGLIEAIRAGAFAALLGIVSLGRGRASFAAAALPAAFLLLAPALAGHASTQEPTWLLLPLDVVHVAAMTLWLGGLAALLLAVPAATSALPAGERSAALADVLRRFSPLALGCVLALAATGTVQAIVEVGSFEALVDTGFGRAVIVKATLLAALIALGYRNRARLIPAIAERAAVAKTPGTTGRRLRSNLRLEVAGIAVALLAAAMMVGYAPPSESASGPVSGLEAVGPNVLEYTVEPATVGPNQIHLYLFAAADGSQVDPRELTATATLASADVGPLTLDLRKAGPGHFVAPAAELGIAGDWSVDVAVRTSRFHQDEVSLAVPIAG